MPRSWLFAGWGIFGACAAVLVAAVLFGRFAESSGVIEAKRYYIEQHTQRTFDDDTFITSLKEHKYTAPVAIIAIRDPEIAELALHLTKALRKGSVSVLAYGDPGEPDNNWPWPVDGTRDDKGIEVLVKDVAHPSEDESGLFNALKEALLNPQYEKITAKWIQQQFNNNVVLLIGYH